MSWVTNLRNSSWFISVEILVGLLAIVGFVISIIGLWMGIADAREGRIVNAWEILGSTSPGNSGKIQAMEYLAARDIPLNGIDISCERMGGFGSSKAIEVETLDGPVRGLEDEHCERLTYLRDIDLSLSSIGDETLLSDANLSYVDLTNADLSGVIMRGSNFDGAILQHTVLNGTDLSDAVLNNVKGFPDLSSAKIQKTQIIESEIGAVEIRADNWPETITESIVRNLHADPQTSEREYALAFPKKFEITFSEIAYFQGLGIQLAALDLTHTVIRKGDLSNSSSYLALDSPEGGLFASANFKDVTFYKTDFRNADLSNAKFENVRFIDCDFRFANFKEAEFLNVEVTGSKFCDETGCVTLDQSQLNGMITIHTSSDYHNYGDGFSKSGSLYSIDMFNVKKYVNDDKDLELVHSVFENAEVGATCMHNIIINSKMDNLNVIAYSRIMNEVANLDFIHQMDLDCS